MAEVKPKKTNIILSFLSSIWKELLFFIIGVFFNFFLCYPKKSFIVKGIAKDDNYKTLANSKVEIEGIGTFYTNDMGEFIIPKFKTQIPKATWWPGCNCTTEEINLDVIATDSIKNITYSKKEPINFSEQVEDTIHKTFYLIENEK